MKQNLSKRSAMTCLIVRVKKLIEQLVKFGVVGAIAFVIDFGLMNLLLAFHVNNVVAATTSFLISLVFNYLASMRYVFVHRDDMARWMEILIFLVSSAIGLLINDLIVWLSTYGMVSGADHAAYTLRTNIGKIIATVVVALWNFVIRKWLLDDTHTHAMAKLGNGKQLSQTELDERWKNSFSYKLGKWSLEHTPQGWPK